MNCGKKKSIQLGAVQRASNRAGREAEKRESSAGIKTRNEGGLRGSKRLNDF